MVSSHPTNNVYSGKLHINILNARLKHDTDLFNKMDPYVVMFIGGSKKRSSTDKKGHLNPVWSEIRSFDINGETSMYLQVMEEDYPDKDDLVGDTTINLLPYLQNPSSEFTAVTTHQLYYKTNLDAGEIDLKFKFVPNTSTAKQIFSTGVTNKARGVRPMMH